MCINALGEFLGQENVNKPEKKKRDINVNFESRIGNCKKIVDKHSRLLMNSGKTASFVCPDEYCHLKMCQVCILERKLGSSCFSLESDNVESLQNWHNTQGQEERVQTRKWKGKDIKYSPFRQSQKEKKSLGHLLVSNYLCRRRS